VNRRIGLKIAELGSERSFIPQREHKLTASDDTLIDVPDTAKTKTWGVGDSEK
jgi:hypothetical protein